LAQVVLKRSYSRICGETSEEIDTLIAGYRPRIESRTCRSWSGRR
jgi:hypothetical protein